MATFFDLFRRGNREVSTQDNIIQDLGQIHEQVDPSQTVSEIHIDEDFTGSDMLPGSVESITESVVNHSPDSIMRMVTSDDFNSDKILSELRASYNLDTTYAENEEMSRDSVVGGAMETITDDASQSDETTGRIISVESSNEDLERFLQDFLDNNVGVSTRIWTWIYEIVKHGDFKLHRCEYYMSSKEDRVKSVYYEDVINPYKVTRIEYMGKVIGYRDEDKEEGQVTFEKSDAFVHFMSVKNSRREKVKLAYRNEENVLEEVTCYKVFGTSIVDNARYIFRIVNLLDNMLILSRVARSTQFNIVKVEVGNASPQKTSQILTDVRRRIEGQTRMRKNTGIKSDPSPIPVNSNIYIPTREGRGDIQVDSVGDNLDLKSIVDVDYFKDKEFATLRVPKYYLGFDNESASMLGNNSLVRMDARYARSVQRVQQVAIDGVTELCNNYLRYRGKAEEIGKFQIKMRPLDTADTMNRVEELVTNMQAIDSVRGSLVEGFSEYIDKAKLLKSVLNLIGISATDIGSEEFLQILKELEEGTYKEENHKKAEPEGGESDGGGMW